MSPPWARLFVPRSGPWRLQDAKLQERFLGSVREWYASRDWVEVQSVIPTKAQVPAAVLLHAIRAAELHGRGACQLAAAECDRALAAPLPAHTALDLRRARKACALCHSATGGRPMEATVQRESARHVR